MCACSSQFNASRYLYPHDLGQKYECKDKMCVSVLARMLHHACQLRSHPETALLLDHLLKNYFTQVVSAEGSEASHSVT